MKWLSDFLASSPRDRTFNQVFAVIYAILLIAMITYLVGWWGR